MFYGYEDFGNQVDVRMGTIPIKNIDLLYYIAANNLLEFLVKVVQDRKFPENKVYLFQKNTYIQDAVNSFYLNPKKRRN
jgi:uncharacterized membrane protein